MSQQPRQHLAGVEELLGELTGGLAVPRVVGVDRGESVDGLLEGREGDDSEADREVPLDPGRLDDDGSARGEVADAPLAEPPRLELDVPAVRHAELAARAADVVRVLAQRSDPANVGEHPTALLEGAQLVPVARMDTEGELEGLRRTARQLPVPAPVVPLPARVAPVELEGRVAVPPGDAREAPTSGRRPSWPVVDHDRRNEWLPVDAAVGYGTAGCSDVHPVREVGVVPADALVDPVDALVDLRVARSAVDVYPRRDALHELGVLELSLDVYEHVGPRRQTHEVPVRQAVRRARRPVDQRSTAPDPVAACNRLET